MAQQKLTAPNPTAGYRFGSAVDISGDYAVMGKATKVPL
ncbi:MAG: FG-GAP repeat protein [Chitinophagales bacterium]